MSLNVSLEFDEYFEEHGELFYMIEHDKEKKTIELCHVNEKKDFIL